MSPAQVVHVLNSLGGRKKRKGTASTLVAMAAAQGLKIEGRGGKAPATPVRSGQGVLSINPEAIRAAVE